MIEKIWSGESPLWRLLLPLSWLYGLVSGACLLYTSASRDRVEDATLVLSVGDEVEAKFTGVDRKNRAISLSVRAKDEADEKEDVYKRQQPLWCNLRWRAEKYRPGWPDNRHRS